MKVYRIRPDVNRYQYFLLAREEDLSKLGMECVPRAADWTPPPVYVYEPKHAVGDFYNFGAAALITSPRATEVLRTHLEQAGELLPLPYQGEDFTVLNILACVDCLDCAASVKKPGLYETYVFHPEKLARVQIDGLQDSGDAQERDFRRRGVARARGGVPLRGRVGRAQRACLHGSMERGAGVVKVYRIRRDPRYQALALNEGHEGGPAPLVFDGSSLAERWTPLAVSIDDRRLEVGDVWCLTAGALVVAPETPDYVTGFFEMAGETLRLLYQGRALTVCNVTECINCLDGENTQWEDDHGTGQRGGIVRYAFHPNRFSASSLFKIPETAEDEMLVVERWRDPEDEFKSAVEEAGLRGILARLSPF